MCLNKGFQRAKETFLYEYFLIRWLAFIWDKKSIPMPHLRKQKVLFEYAKKFNTEILIETGTYMGHMVNAMKRKFKKIVSIELNHQFAIRAKNRFKKYPHIDIVEGNSGIVLENVLKPINERIIFWLDGHYSGGITAKGSTDSPAIQEIETILNHPIKNHVILIDDARLLGTNGYPTINMVKQMINQKLPYYEIKVSEDIVRIFPVLE